MISIYWLCLLSGVTSLVLTETMRRYAVNKSLIDLPNNRGAHDVPTPRGGGGAIVLGFFVALLFLSQLESESTTQIIAVIGAGVIVALVGFIDDHGHVAARWRLLVHFLASFWILYWLGGVPPVSLFGFLYDVGIFGSIIVAIWLVWLLNLFNFMDGIDGLASIEALTVCVGGAIISASVTADSLGVLIPLVLSGAVAGFLIWNYPPAKIFMGDVGSGFLGITLGALMLHAAWADSNLLWSWIILLGVFVVDSTFTLLRRVIRGDKIYEAHRTHAYQYAARQFGSHKVVSLFVGLINLMWLFPISLIVGLGWVDGVAGVVFSYIPLIWLAYYFNAGKSELLA